MRHTHTEREADTGRGRSRLAPCREPDAGLDPRTPGSCPGLKADAKPLSHPGIPRFYLFFIFLFFQDFIFKYSLHPTWGFNL